MTMLTRPAVDLKVAEKARPRLGTEHGERTQGNCAWPPCRRVLRTCDHFVVTLSGELYCVDCNLKRRFRPLRLTRP